MGAIASAYSDVVAGDNVAGTVACVGAGLDAGMGTGVSADAIFCTCTHYQTLMKWVHACPCLMCA